jgi:hypothetical protein
MAHLLVVILGIYNQLRAKIVRWIGYDVIPAAVNAQIIQIKSMMQQLILLITWTRAYGEIALLYAEDLTVLFAEGIGLMHTASGVFKSLTRKIAMSGLAFALMI